MPSMLHCNNIIHNLMQHPQPDASITVGDIKILDENTNGEVKTVLFWAHCAKHLASCLANDQAVLLSTVYDDFVHEVESNKYQHKLKICKDDIPEWRWILSRLNQNFNGLLEVHLKHNRYGLVLFLKNCNLVAAMSSALGKLVMGVKHAHAQGVK